MPPDIIEQILSGFAAFGVMCIILVLLCFIHIIDEHTKK